MQVVYTGRFPGDGTGDPGKTAFDKLNANDAELAAAIAGLGGTIGLLYKSDTISVDTNNYTQGGTFPAMVFQLDLLLATQNCQLTGIQAGLYNGQTLWIRNAVTSTFVLNLTCESTGSNPANRFSGPGTAVGLFPGMKTAALYNTTLARWVI